MSRPEVADGTAERTPVGIDEPAQMDDVEHGSAPSPGVVRPLTGDPAVDDVLAQLDRVAGQPLDTQIEVSKQVHRVLQGRLADLGKE